MKKLNLLIVLLLIFKAAYALPINTVKFGNALYVNLAKGKRFAYLGKTVEVLETEQHRSLVRVGNEQAWLEVAKRALPKNIGGLRVFVSDQTHVKNLTTDTPKHNLLTKDVLLCLSDPAKPLLENQRFVFPISKRDGYTWEMAEDSHMFAYLGLSKWLGPDYYRSHEGIDLNMHEARGKEMHPLVAIESGTVVLVADSTITKSYDGCIIIKSDTQDNIYYVYKHTHPKTHKVKAGQKVKKGDMLSYIWGDNVWGHLHFAIVYRTDTPTYGDRYTNLLNIFPQMYELHFGGLEPVRKVRSEGQFTFGHRKQTCRNFKRLDAFNELIGYGWNLDNWCTAQKVEEAESDIGGNARLKRTLHAGTKAECENPGSYYDFEVLVENGQYLVHAIVGDSFEPSSQKVYFENTEVGLFELGAGAYEKTKDHTIQVSDNRLTVRLALGDGNQWAGIKELNFEKVDG